MLGMPIASLRLTQTRLRPWSHRTLLRLTCGLLAGLLLTACAGGSPKTIELQDSESLRPIIRLRDLAIEKITTNGRAPTYEEALTVMGSEGFKIVSGASRDSKTVSMELERAPRGLLPLAVALDGDCLIVRIEYPVDQSAVSTGDVRQSWFLIRDYVRNTERNASAICAGQATFGMEFDGIEASNDPMRPTLLD